MGLDTDILSQSPGSPSYQYGLAPTNFITAVNGVKTSNLDEFVTQVSKIPDNTYFRLRAVTFDNVPWVVTMKKNDHYVSPVPYLGLLMTMSCCVMSRLVRFSYNVFSSLYLHLYLCLRLLRVLSPFLPTPLAVP